MAKQISHYDADHPDQFNNFSRFCIRTGALIKNKLAFYPLTEVNGNEMQSAKHAGKGYAPNSLTIYPLTKVNGNEMQSARHAGKGYAPNSLTIYPLTEVNGNEWQRNTKR